MRTFSARETEWLLELDGIELASFQRRALALVIDGCLIAAVFVALFAVVVLVFLGVHLAILKLHGSPMPRIDQLVIREPFNLKNSEPSLIKVMDGEVYRLVNEIAVPILYFGVLLWRGKGQTPGKRMMRIRVVSLVHRHLSFWHCVERALGYGAAALEGGFGFVQFFLHPYRRCAQDRLAETIVVTETGYRAMQVKLEHPLIPDVIGSEGAAE